MELIRFTVPHHTRPESRLLFNKTSQNQVVTFQEMGERFTTCSLIELICDPATACQRQNEVFSLGVTLLVIRTDRLCLITGQNTNHRVL